MTLSRRNLLSAFAALSGTAASGVTPAQVAAAATVPFPPPPSQLDGFGSDVQLADPRTPNYWQITAPMRDALQKRIRELQPNVLQMPARITSKRSWSEAYKETRARAEQEALRDALERLENETTWETALRLLQGASK